MKQNLKQKLETQKKIFFATMLSFVFFVIYDFTVIQPAMKQQEIVKQQQQKQQKDKIQTSKEAPKETPKVQNKEQAQAKAPITNSGSIISKITTKNSIIEIDNLGRISQVTLLNKIYTTKNGHHIKLFKGDESVKPLEVRFSDEKINELAFKVNAVASAKELDATNNKVKLTLTQKLDGVILTKEITFYPDNHYDVKIYTNKDELFFVSPGFRPSVIVDNYAVHGVLLKLNDNTLTVVEDGKLKNSKNFIGIKIVSAFDRYYTTLLYNFNKSFEITLMPTSKEDPQVFIHSKKEFVASGYIGPKNYEQLKAINPQLIDVIEYGWFTFIAKPIFAFLKYLHNIFGNWGWAIVVITIVMKILLYPLTYKGMVSMQKLKDLAPKIKQLQEKYKDDPQKLSVHMMELYKKYDANPMGGCLPMLLQIPIFFGLYRVLINAIELKGSPWILWIDDLSKMDPYFVLPILMGITMYIQQKITPNTIQDETQRKLMQFLPVIFTFFFAMFPAGLTLYWFINNLLTVAQQYYINKLFEKKKALFRK